MASGKFVVLWKTAVSVLGQNYVNYGVVAPCSLLEVNRLFRCTCCPHPQGCIRHRLDDGGGNRL